MFYNLSKAERIAMSILSTLIFMFIFSLIFSIANIIEYQSSSAIISAIKYLFWPKLIISSLLGFLVGFGNYYSLNTISSEKTGQGQYGTARFCTKSEMRKIYKFVKFGEEKEPGFIIGIDNDFWIVDTSDNNMLVLAPPGGGKTKYLIIPTIRYNALVNKNTGGNGASMLFTDCKGELLNKCGTALEDSGIKTLFLDFRNPLKSYQFNLMYNINKFMNDYKATENESDKIKYYGRAERYAKVLSSLIVKNIDTGNQNESSNFFSNTSEGLITGIILLVSEFAETNEEKHIISVFKLIIELNGLTENSSDTNQKSKLSKLLDNLQNERLINYVGPAMSADNRTAMNVFSSALSKLVAFIDAELEQLICNHSVELNDEDFIKSPTAIFLIVPDENTTRHFFSSLFIRYLMNDLIEQAEYSINNGVLPRQVLAICDEFGNQPAIKDFDVLATAIRSRGIRLLISLQSYTQLQKSYSKEMSKIILDACQITMFTYVSPSSRETAKELSETLGKSTIQSGSISLGKNHSKNLQMIGRSLMTADEIINISKGSWVIMKAGNKASKTDLKLYWLYLKSYEDYSNNMNITPIPIKYTTAEKFMSINNNKNKKPKLFQGQFE